MARIRRRRTRVSWLPTIPQTIGQVATTRRAFNLVVPPTGTHIVTVVPLTWDYPFDVDVANIAETSMADFIGSAYLLRRVVGKIFTANLSDINGPEAIYLGVGLFVAKADSTNPQIPAATADNFDPLEPYNMREPWIWRRTWILNNASNPSQASGTRPTWPVSNAEYGSVMDGPHIDAKTRRYINDDNRLWLAAGAHNMAVTMDQDGSATVIYDLRFVGSLRRNRGTSAF